jgi:PAS domain S-box-containing protein
MLMNAPIFVFLFNLSTLKIEFANEYVFSLTGYSSAEFKERTVEEIMNMVPTEDLNNLRMAFEVMMSGQDSDYYGNSFRIRHKDGSLKRVNSKERVYKRDSEGHPTHLLCSVMDVTEQYSAERYKEALTRLQSLQQKKTQKIRNLSLLQGQEEERKRLSRELHDGIGQLLTAIRIKLNDIEHQNIEDAKLKAKIEDVKDIVIQTIKEARNISNALVPIDLYDFGLDSALKKLTETARQHAGCEVSFNSNLDGHRLNPTIEIEVFRITQEAVNNSIKYASAKSIDVNLSYSEKNGTLKIMIIDDGNGFDYDPDYIYKKNTSRSFGIRNMNERARIISGKLAIISHKGQGCVISLEVPLKLNAP